MGTKPRILACITSYFPDVGGAEIALRQVAERLADAFEFSILTSRLRRERPRRELLREAEIRRLGFGCPMDKWLLPGLALASRRALGAGDQAPSLLWGLDITQASLAAALLRRRNPRLPLVLTIQYGDSLERLARGRAGLIARSLRLMLSRADHVTAISSPLAALAQEYGYRRPVTLIPNGVDLETFRRRDPRSASTAPTVTTVGRLVRKNGVDIVLHAIARLAGEMPDIRCRVVGDGPERGALERLASDLRLGGCLRFCGVATQQEVAQHLWESDVFVRPSRSEGMGTAFVEALAAGVPIIGTPVGGITDIIRDEETGLLARASDPDDLAEKIRRVLTRKDLAAHLARQGLAMVRERFDADSVARSYARVFHEVLQA